MMLNHIEQEQLALQMIKYLKEANKAEIQAQLDGLHPYDIAQIFITIPSKHHARLLSFLEIAQIANILEQTDSQQQQNILNKLSSDRVPEILNKMDNDDLANLLLELSPEDMETLLTSMQHEESQAVQILMKYEPETAGRLMTNRFVWIPQHYTVDDVVNKLKEYVELAEALNYLYVIDEQQKLVGVVSYRKLILSDGDEQVKNIMYERVISVTVDTDQELAAKMIERYDFLSLPVVDHHHVLVGIITIDDMVDVLIKEATEDIEKLSASGKNIDFDTKAPIAAYRRLPWLILLLFIGLVAGSIVSSFEATLEKVVALSFFMPMISGMTGNTGTQSLAIVVRGLNTKDINKKVVIKLIFRELGVGILIGFTCGILISIIAYLWQGNAVLGLVIGSTLTITLIIGTLTGTIIPLLLHHFKFDPAIASGPLITTLNDVLSLTIYFTIATMFINRLM